MNRILITGSSGQLGQALLKISDRYADLELDFKNKEELDITSIADVENYFENNNLTYCVNCAAYTDVEQAEKTPDPAYRVNAHGAENIARACLKNNVILIHISTDYVFDGTKDTPYKPGDAPNPINEYGRSKWEGERIIQKLLKSYYIIRTSWLYSSKGSNFYTKVIQKAKARKKLQITDEQKGCPTNAINLAHYILELIRDDQRNYGIYHYTDGEVMTWFELAKKILAQENLADQVTLEKVTNYRTFARRPKNSVLAQD